MNAETSGCVLIVEVRSIAHLTFPSRFIKCSSSGLVLRYNDGSYRGLESTVKVLACFVLVLDLF